LVTESHFTGRLASELVPSPFGPRKHGQFCACTTDVKLNIKIERKILKDLIFAIMRIIILIKKNN